MTRRAVKLTPEALIGAPRRSAGIPNADATQILFIESTWSFEEHAWHSKKLCLLDASRGEIYVILADKDLGDVLWLDTTEEDYSSTILVLMSGRHNSTQVIIGDTDNWTGSKQTVATIDAPVGNLKLTRIEGNKYGIAVTGMADTDGTLFNTEKVKKTASTGRLYRSLFVRHWDTWRTPQRESIFYASLEKSGEKWTMSDLKNVLKDTGLESPMEPFGGTDNFDISPAGIIFAARDPTQVPALSTKCVVYFVPLCDFTADPTEVVGLSVADFNGAVTSPIFSLDGKKAAFLAMKKDGYEADRNHVFVIEDIHMPATITCLTTDEEWDRSPSALVFSTDSETLFLKAEDHGRTLLFAMSSRPEAGAQPQALTSDATVTSISPLSNGNVFLTQTSLIDSCLFLLMGSEDPKSYSTYTAATISSNSAQLGLTRSSVSHMYSPAFESGLIANDQIHSWVFLPPSFDPAEKYPLAFLVHGGPQSSWLDAWSMRWNPACFAAQGYVVVCPNPTGSTGYGQRFTDAIQGEWGGRPYQDLVLAFKHIQTHLPYVDTTRAVGGGASYGGYMTNWMQGNWLGRQFKALFCHDGVFSTSYTVATDELYFPICDFGGSWSEARANWQRWDPAERTHMWETPQLVIHSERDYRLTVADGLAAFNVLQQRGVESELLTFPDENHFVLNPDNSLKWHEVLFNWINRHVGLPPCDALDVREIVMDPEFDGARRQRKLRMVVPGERIG